MLRQMLTAGALFYNFRAARKIAARVSAYGQYDYLRDRFAGVEHRNVFTGGLDYLLLDRAPTACPCSAASAN